MGRRQPLLFPGVLAQVQLATSPGQAVVVVTAAVSPASVVAAEAEAVVRPETRQSRELVRMAATRPVVASWVMAETVARVILLPVEPVASAQQTLLRTQTAIRVRRVQNSPTATQARVVVVVVALVEDLAMLVTVRLEGTTARRVEVAVAEMTATNYPATAALARKAPSSLRIRPPARPHPRGSTILLRTRPGRALPPAIRRTPMGQTTPTATCETSPSTTTSRTTSASRTVPRSRAWKYAPSGTRPS